MLSQRCWLRSACRTTAVAQRRWRHGCVAFASATRCTQCATHTSAATATPSRAPPQRCVRRWHVTRRSALDTSAGATASATVAADTSTRCSASSSSSNSNDDGDDAATLPAALRRAQATLNTRRKTWLMAALGSDFVRAGLCHHGVQTSFSAVQSQSLQQLTGLPHIPAKLLLSCLTAGCSGSSSSSSTDPACERYEWVDVSAHPTATLAEFRAALTDVLPRLGVPLAAVEGNAEPVQLPQATLLTSSSSSQATSDVNSSNSDNGAASRRRGTTHPRCQLILRYALDTTATGLHGRAAAGAGAASSQAASFQDLTNRFTLYLLPGRVVTVHRSECVFVEELKLRWRGVCAREHVRDGRYVAQYFVRATLATFSRALTRCIAEFDAYEAGLFAARLDRAALAREIYHIKRRATVYARTLTMTQDAFAHTATALQMHPASVRYQEIQHDMAHIHALADGLNANADSVLQILFQLSSYQVNELMRVLTLFSAFFIPLSFIAAVYGMNFEQLPFLNTPHGELYCGMLMCVVAFVIYMWFKGNHFI